MIRRTGLQNCTDKMSDSTENEVFPDLQRAEKTGFSEVIYCPGKTEHQLRTVASVLLEQSANLLATRATAEQASVLREVCSDTQYAEVARVAFVHRDYSLRGSGKVVIVAAGTCDLPVAEEAAVCAQVMGNTVERVYDVGVAGLHRILSRQQSLHSATVVIVVAGMEGALPSVVGGLVSCPVIAVPTSVGYGASFSGLAPLLGMLNSCAPGVTVVNIDNGFGAAFAASRINCNKGNDNAPEES